MWRFGFYFCSKSGKIWAILFPWKILLYKPKSCFSGWNRAKRNVCLNNIVCFWILGRFILDELSIKATKTIVGQIWWPKPQQQTKRERSIDPQIPWQFVIDRQIPWKVGCGDEHSTLESHNSSKCTTRTLCEMEKLVRILTNCRTSSPAFALWSNSRLFN
jgi:hypothetical protein